MTTYFGVELDELHQRAKALWDEGKHALFLELINGECPDPQCQQCAVLCCPEGDPEHFNEDGCPTCDTEEESDGLTCRACGVDFSDGTRDFGYCNHGAGCLNPEWTDSSLSEIFEEEDRYDDD